MWNKIFRQSYQSTTMLHNECMHTFLYVFGHCGENMLGLLLILIIWGGRRGGGCLGAVFLLEVFSQASSQQHG
jgi:hypothetical protein